MSKATLTRGSTTVELPLISQGGEILVAVDVGKPHQTINGTGEINPLPTDFWSGLEQYTFVGQFTTSNAYDNAIELADLIKENAGDPPDPLILNIDMPEYDSDIKVAPGAGVDESLSLSYDPGRSNWVVVDLTLTRVYEYASGYNQPATTPTASGNGPIQLSYRGSTIDLVEDVTVTRGVGRPNSVVRRRPDQPFPTYRDQHNTAMDRFEISTRLSDSDYLTDLNELVTMFNTQLGRTSMELRFNGMYGMGTFEVVPEGSGSLRHQRRAGEEGTKLLPSIQLRRVNTPG